MLNSIATQRRLKVIHQDEQDIGQAILPFLSADAGTSQNDHEQGENGQVERVSYPSISHFPGAQPFVKGPSNDGE